MAGDLPTHAEIVIVGGGVAGASLAWQLTRLGKRDIVLVERGTLTCGTSWHAAGLIMQIRATHAMTDLSRFNAEVYPELEAETGLSTGFKQNGTLAIARNADRLHELKHRASIAKTYGIAADLITAREAGELYPGLDTSVVEGALFIPKDGQLNAVDTVMAFMAGARRNGARVFENSPVTDIARLGATGGYRVTTPQGTITCDTLVLACGLWTRELAARLGAVVPLNPCEHFYVVTDALDIAKPGLPVLRDTDGYVYIKEDAGKLLVGAFEPQAKPLPMRALPARAEFIELPEDWDHFALPYSKACESVPALEKVGISHFMNGPESFTPDANFAIGEVPGLPGLFVSAGYNSEGFEMAPGASRALAEWIVEGEATMDLADVDVARFHPFQMNTSYVEARAAESLSSIFHMHWPNLQRHSARPARKSPLHDRLAARGACFGETLGWERANWYAPAGVEPRDRYSWHRPNWYEHTAAECRATRENVALFDLSSFGKHLVQGRDACRLLQRLCANDVDVAPGRIVYTHMLNRRGGIEVDVTVNRLAEDRYMVVSSAAFQPRDRAWIERHVAPDDRVWVSDVTSGWAVLSVQGPQSRGLLQGLTDADLSNEAFPFASSREIDIGYARVLANRLTFVGELGWELYVPTEFVQDVYDRIAAAGAGVGLQHAGYHALEHLRSERAYREFSLDLTPDDTPYEAGLGFAVKLDKPGGFIGLDAIAPQRGQVLNKRLVMFCLEDPGPDLHKDELIRMNGEVVGYLRSGVYSFTLGRAIGMGYVRHEGGVSAALLRENTFEIEIAGERHPAQASLQAFFDPKGERARG
ncbi:GcvT family protein [Defluviimonas sp. SAOS-178_SWC]|uniref:GcvT family protein n=1 Tax=Defluviimonas sp. SAOS-178_SWC TaxID=3121287 RepID=UPI00322177AF